MCIIYVLACLIYTQSFLYVLITVTVMLCTNGSINNCISLSGHMIFTLQIKSGNYYFVSVAIHTRCRVSSKILQTISNWSVQKNVAAKMFILSTHYNALLLMVCNTGQDII